MVLRLTTSVRVATVRECTGCELLVYSIRWSGQVLCHSHSQESIPSECVRTKRPIVVRGELLWDVGDRTDDAIPAECGAIQDFLC
jgi:hypothetical protein